MPWRAGSVRAQAMAWRSTGPGAALTPNRRSSPCISISWVRTDRTHWASRNGEWSLPPEYRALRPKLLILGEALQPSGYARVLAGILPGLADRFDVDVFAVSYRGPVIRGRWNVHPNRSDSDEFGVYQLGDLLQRLRPEILLIVFDYELYLYNRATIAAYGDGLRTVLYCPIDGDFPDPVWVRDLEGVDRLVLFTQQARRTIEDALGPECPPVRVMPHGVDSAAFRPLSGLVTSEGVRRSRADARRQLFPGRPELWDGFFVLNANRNNMRKRIDLTMEAFAAFARGKPENVRLYLHMRREQCCNIPEMARRFEIERRVLLTRESTEEPDVDDGSPQFDIQRLRRGDQHLDRRGLGTMCLRACRDGGRASGAAPQRVRGVMGGCGSPDTAARSSPLPDGVVRAPGDRGGGCLCRVGASV